MCKFILIQGNEIAGKTTTCWKIHQDLVAMLPKDDNGNVECLPKRLTDYQSTSGTAPPEYLLYQTQTTQDRMYLDSA